MWVARFYAVLLPLGVWLILSAATPRTREARVAASGLVVIVISSLVYYAVGFGLMFGGVGIANTTHGFGQLVSMYSIPIDNHLWGMLGLTGFFLDGISANAPFDLLVNYLPITATCSLLLISLFSNRDNIGLEVVSTAIVSGVILPIVGCWLWAGGWLASTGENLSLGHGGIDIGGITTAGLVAGTAGLVWLLAAPRRQPPQTAVPPASFFPFRALTGAVFALVGATAFVAGNPLFDSFSETIASAFMLNALLACGIAVLISLIYSTFTGRTPNLVSAGRALIAALIIISAGSILLPTWSLILIGLIAGLLSTVGYYLVNEVWLLHDEPGIVPTILLPAILGMVFVGLFAGGNWAAGWNGIGTSSYLGISKLGVVGAFPSNGMPSDPGQLTAQIAVICIVITFAGLVYAPVALMYARKRVVQATLNETATIPVLASVAISEVATPILQTGMTQGNSITDAGGNLNTQPVIEPKESLLERLRRARRLEPQNNAPTQARHTAYPTRVRGRRIFMRPLARSTETQSAGDATKPANETQ
jgi:ammonium transporter, Amt family